MENNYQKLTVEIPGNNYEIIIGPGAMEQAGVLIKKLVKDSKVFIVTDDVVSNLYLEKLVKILQAESISPTYFVIPHGEKSKNLNTLERLCNDIFANKPDRKSLLIALGGGVIGDLTGFAASIILRGIRFIQIPTTLLAQVDSSVGGKTGINNSFGKNLIGSFYQPSLVISDTNIIKSLPKRQFLAGYAEIIKYGVIRDIEFFEYLENNYLKILNYDAEVLGHIIYKSCQAKAEIVAMDEKEAEIRALLNFGHTFGHALEMEAGYSDLLLHGEAVAIGMVFAMRLSEKLGLIDADATLRLVQHLENVGLNCDLNKIKSGWNKDLLKAAMYQDKKASNAGMTFILINAIGDAFIQHGVDESSVMETVEEFIN